MNKPPFEIFRVSVPDGEYSRRADVVEKLHYDAAQVELARLEDEFDTLEHSNITLKLKLAGADKRNAELIEFLAKARRSIDPSCAGKKLREELDAILKTTKSGTEE
jgi:hypothetical protein